jgi:hypothetical protein
MTTVSTLRRIVISAGSARRVVVADHEVVEPPGELLGEVPQPGADLQQRPADVRRHHVVLVPPVVASLVAAEMVLQVSLSGGGLSAVGGLRLRAAEQAEKRTADGVLRHAITRWSRRRRTRV